MKVMDFIGSREDEGSLWEEMDGKKSEKEELMGGGVFTKTMDVCFADKEGLRAG